MADFKSHSRIENELAPHFRERLSHAESAGEARRFFAHEMLALLQRVLGEQRAMREGDVALASDGTGYQASARLAADADWQRAIANSDLHAIITRFAEAAQHRVRHLEGHPERTQSKIRARQGQ